MIFFIDQYDWVGSRLYLKTITKLVPKPEATSSKENAVEKSDEKPKTAMEFLNQKLEEDDKFDRVDEYSIVVMPEKLEVQFPYQDIPDQLFQVIQTAIHATGRLYRSYFCNAINKKIKLTA